MDGFNGAKAIGIVVGGLALLGVLIWGAVRYWMIFSKQGGGMPLAIAIVCTLLILGWLAGAAKMLL
jgi:hypothetical protein